MDIFNWDRLSVGCCKNCGGGHSLIDGLCFACRPIEDTLQHISSTVPTGEWDKVPSDLSENVDQYLDAESAR